MASVAKHLLITLITVLFSMNLLSCAYFKDSTATIKPADAKTIPPLRIPSDLASNRIQQPNFLISQHYPPPSREIDLTPPGLNN